MSAGWKGGGLGVVGSMIVTLLGAAAAFAVPNQDREVFRISSLADILPPELVICVGEMGSEKNMLNTGDVLYVMVNPLKPKKRKDRDAIGGHFRDFLRWVPISVQEVLDMEDLLNKLSRQTGRIVYLATIDASFEWEELQVHEVSISFKIFRLETDDGVIKHLELVFADAARGNSSTGSLDAATIDAIRNKIALSFAVNAHMWAEPWAQVRSSLDEVVGDSLRESRCK